MLMQSDSAGVVVVGAGPSGLVVSSALRVAEIDVRTVDAASAHPSAVNAVLAR